MLKSRPKLLIVDDDNADRQQILRSISHSGLDCECKEAISIDEALTALHEESFDCIILDYYLPGLDGLGGISALLERDSFMPLIMSTGQGNERVATQAIKLGAMDYINKAHLNADLIRQAIENALERGRLNRKLAEQQAALAGFARVLVHDIKAPVQSIFGFARIIEVSLGQPKFDVKSTIQLSQRLALGALRLVEMVDALHAYTQADKEPELKDTALNDVMSNVLTNLNAMIEKTGASVTHEKLPFVMGDAARLTQLLQNLVANAIKYCQADRPEVHIGARLHEGRYIVEIRDNGIGIPEKDCQIVFQPFKRLHTQGEYEGTGLGLATCKKIVEQHGGSIWCKSAPGKGTSFFFTLQSVIESRRIAANS